ncbi:circularly permuted type 2 ATP-grasp protein [Aeromonas caviae]|nr:circularly permuted type 2 ATP-grasp protein [Aeromonas caviae]
MIDSKRTIWIYPVKEPSCHTLLHWPVACIPWHSTTPCSPISILNNVPTWQCREPAALSHVLANLEELVVKEVHGAGGYGMLIGPCASREELARFRELLKARPDNYIAQPTLSLSTCPTFVDAGIAPRHIDLRPFVLTGQELRLVPGGLTRVALTEGSLVVNSSQGGGTKDTWVMEGSPC